MCFSGDLRTRGDLRRNKISLSVPVKGEEGSHGSFAFAPRSL